MDDIPEFPGSYVFPSCNPTQLFPQFHLFPYLHFPNLVFYPVSIDMKLKGNFGHINLLSVWLSVGLTNTSIFECVKDTTTPGPLHLLSSAQNVLPADLWISDSL